MYVVVLIIYEKLHVKIFEALVIDFFWIYN